MTITGRVVAFSVGVAITLSFGAGAEAAPSPTGRQPKFLWTDARQSTWNRMKADYDSNPGNPPTLGGMWYGLVKQNAECGCRYNDTGLWATFMYQWTGDLRYKDLAWAKVQDFLALPSATTDGNYVREYGTEHVIMLDWLWPGLTQIQRDQYANAIGTMLDHALTGNPYVQGFPLGDSDQLVGDYFGVVAFHLLLPNHAIGTMLYNRADTGGITPTGGGQPTARNTVKTYVESMAAGGEWIESSEYNLGTVRLLLMGAEAVKTATGTDYFPEVSAWLPGAARRQIAYWTPDLIQTYQWGDTEHPRGDERFQWTNTSGLIAGLLQGAPEGAQLQQHLLDLIAKYGAVGSGSMEPAITGRLFYTFNPYAPASDWRTRRAFFAPGQGLMLFRSGFTSTDSLFAGHQGTRPASSAVDHFVRYLGDFELWRKGEWAITHPRGYAGPPNTGVGVNAVLMQGFSDMPEFKKTVAGASADDFAYSAATTGGSAVFQPYYAPPRAFVQEWTRSLFFLPGATDTVVVYDRANVTDVKDLDRFYPADLTLINSAPAPKQWLMHMPVAPTLTSSAVDWSTPKGQPVRLTPMLPVGGTRTVYDEHLMSWATAVSASELGWQVRFSPSVKKDWDTFLNVVQVGTPTAMELVKQDGEVEGVRLSRSQKPDAVVLFNARPSAPLADAAFDPSHVPALEQAHVRLDGYTVRWTTQASSADAFLLDLSPQRAWTVSIDGASDSPVDVSSGVARVSVAGAGQHSLTIRTTGTVSTLPATPTGLMITAQ